MSTLRDEVPDLRQRLKDAERTAEELPHRQTYLLIVIEFLNRLIDLHVELVAEVEQKLGG